MIDYISEYFRLFQIFRHMSAYVGIFILEHIRKYLSILGHIESYWCISAGIGAHWCIFIKFILEHIETFLELGA